MANSHDNHSNSAAACKVIKRDPRSLTPEELKSCVRLIADGSAVDSGSAARQLPCAQAVVLAIKKSRIVGVGAIKRERPPYVAKISKSSGHPLDANLPELGYVAVDKGDRGQGIGYKIVDLLLSGNHGPLFATTGNDSMKRILCKAGFVEIGKEWEGKRGRLSLWLKD